MKRFISILVFMMALVLVVSGCSKKKASVDAEGNAYQYYTAEETKKFIEEDKDWIMLDIQVEEDWDAHHIKGAIPSYAYPAKTDEDKAKLDSIMSELEGDKEILVICPGGGSGATNTIDYLIEKGIEADRFFILEKGQKAWAYDELLEQ